MFSCCDKYIFYDIPRLAVVVADQVAGLIATHLQRETARPQALTAAAAKMAREPLTVAQEEAEAARVAEQEIIS